MNTARRLVFFTAVVSLLALAARGDTTQFNIHVVPHAGFGAARVLVTLELSGPPGAATLSSGGDSSPVPGLFNHNGDEIIATVPTVSLGDPDQIKIQYTLKSAFPGGNFCGPGISVPVDLPLTLITPGGVSVTAFRATTYTAASNAGDISIGTACGSSPKRITANQATVSFIAVSPTDKGRQPLDVILVLDESGSMASLPPGPTPGVLSRWAILNNSVQSFVNRWEVIDAPVAGKEWSTDRIGVVFFSTGTTPASFSGNFFLRRGTNPPGLTHNWKAIIDTVATHGPTNSTALGQGVNAALQAWEPLPAATTTKNDAEFVVITDGIQNVDPKIQPVMNLPNILQLAPTGGGTPVALFIHNVPMQTVAFGTPDTVEINLLDGIAQQTFGQSRQTADAFGTSDAFADALVNILKGGTVSLAFRGRDTLTTAVGPLVPVEVDGSVERAMFSVEWLIPRARLDLQVFPPGVNPGPTDVGIPPTQRADTATSTVQGFDLPASGGTGTWHVRVVTKPDVELPPGGVPYNLSAHMLEGRLRYFLNFDKITAGTGDRLGVSAEVAYDQKPLSGLPANAIQVRISRPPQGLSNILHERVINIPAAGPGDVTTPYNRKVDAIAANAAVFNGITPAPVTTISLADAGNGVYTGSFNDASVPGQYPFDVTLEWNDPRTGHIHRTERLERSVPVKPDAASTAIAVTPLGTPGSFSIRVTPRDRFGNYVGPGNGAFIVATASNGTIAGPPVDTNETGDYVFRIDGVPPGQPPNVTFTDNGNNIGTTSPFPVVGPGGGGPWRLFLDAGPNFPHGGFASGVDGKFSVNLGLERIFPTWSVEGILGYHEFDAGFFTGKIWQLSVNGKHFFGAGPWHPFVNGGVGAYRFDPGNTTRGGANVGGGVLYDLSSKWAVEGVYNYHYVHLNGGNVTWSALQAGFRVHL